MHKPAVSYGQLDGVLQSLGFNVRVEKGQRRLYKHEDTGAVMSLPDRKPNRIRSPDLRCRSSKSPFRLWPCG